MDTRYSYDRRTSTQNPTSVVNKILRAIKSLYGPKEFHVQKDPSQVVYVKVTNYLAPGGLSREERLTKLEDAVKKAVPVKIRLEMMAEDSHPPLMVIYAKGDNPYSGYSVAITTDEKGRIVRRSWSPQEAANSGYDMW